MSDCEVPLDELAALAVEVAHEAGGLLLGYYDGAGPSDEVASSIGTKSSRTDVVTEADKKSEALVLARLHESRPHDSVLAEEGGARSGSSGLTWVVDPLDGTVNFVYGFPSFAVSIACQHGPRRLVGVVYDPLREETFLALRGGGARRDDEPLRIDDGPPLAEALVATGFSYDADRRQEQAALLATVLPEVRDLRRAGAAALDLCWLAAGRVDAYYEAGLAPWDMAAGSLVVTEAGGEIELVDGLLSDGTPTVVAGPGELRRELVSLLERASRDAGRG